MAKEKNNEQKRYSVNLITQGKFKFYSFTIPSDVLAKTCFVSTRDEDNTVGFQRVLDKKRAEAIASYIDSGQGSIPTAIILSAQPDSEFKLVGQGKTITFKEHPKSFLVLDGQHRVFGFSLAETALRVPVVVYSGLSREDETRLFIDINTQQKPVPPELLLDIKNLANYENDKEALLRKVFNLIHSQKSNALYGLFSPHEKAKDKISRVTFNAGVGGIINSFGARSPGEIAEILSAYYLASIEALTKANPKGKFTHPIIFKALNGVFNNVAQRVKDKRGGKYSVEAFYEVVFPMLSRTKNSHLEKPGNSYREMMELFKSAITSDFSI